MNNLLVMICLLLLIAMLSSCSSSSSVSEKRAAKSGAENIYKVHTSNALKAADTFVVLLRNEFQYWKGTPYRLGGQTKKGIDCSALVQNVYYNSFNFPLPRLAKSQSKVGFFVHKNDLQIGDLLFFKTSWRGLHVGIYMGDMQFFHTSTRNGVTISSLNNVYWKSKYWQARRIIDLNT